MEKSFKNLVDQFNSYNRESTSYTDLDVFCCDDIGDCSRCPFHIKTKEKYNNIDNCWMNCTAPFSKIIKAAVHMANLKVWQRSQPLLNISKGGKERDMNQLFITGRLVSDWKNVAGEGKNPVYVNSIAWNQDDKTAHFFDLKAFKEVGQRLFESTGKGVKIALQGTLVRNDYTKNDGTKVNRWEIIATSFDYLEPKK